jgi:hypothetical protein
VLRFEIYLDANVAPHSLLYAPQKAGRQTMSAMIVHLQVRDYESWRVAFEASTSHRRADGFSNERIFRSTEDGNDLVLLMDVSDLKKAKEFAVSDGRKAAMERNGVTGTPIDYFVE